MIDDTSGKWWLMYTGYENGYALYGKESLLVPVGWTPDGWPRVALGVSATDTLAKPPGENVGHGMPLSDDFSAVTIGIQWQYSPQVDPAASFHVGGGALKLEAAGSIPGLKSILPADATTLSVMPVNHSYEAEVEVTITDTAEGGLMLDSGGRGANTWATVGLRKGQALATWGGQSNYLNWDGNHIFIRIRNRKYDVSCFYSTDGKNWTPFANSTHVTEGRRLSLYGAGTGEVMFQEFQVSRFGLRVRWSAVKRFAMLMVLGAGLSQLSAVPPVPTYLVKHAGSPIVIDGQADEPAWAAAESMPLSSPWSSGSPKTTVKLLWDDNFLYLAADCDQPSPSNSEPKSHRRRFSTDSAQSRSIANRRIHRRGDPSESDTRQLSGGERPVLFPAIPFARSAGIDLHPWRAR